jgi:hypothetical protein
MILSCQSGLTHLRFRLLVCDPDALPCEEYADGAPTTSPKFLTISENVIHHCIANLNRQIAEPTFVRKESEVHLRSRTGHAEQRYSIAASNVSFLTTQTEFSGERKPL